MLPPSSSAPRTGARSRGTPVRGRPGNHWLARLPRLAASAALSTRPSLQPGPPPAEELRRLHIRSNRKCLVFSILSADVHYVEMKSTRIFVRACPSPCITVISIYRGDGVTGEVTTGDEAQNKVVFYQHPFCFFPRFSLFEVGLFLCHQPCWISLLMYLELSTILHLLWHLPD